MTVTGTEKHPGVQRCAVCKIDRKGRFILADPGAQDLFGLGEVELFGRPLGDFVEPADHAVIEAITANRNSYETVFDAAPVTLLDHQQNRIAATLIISVNFGGGNPANYQVIIYTDRPPTADTTSAPSQAWLEYLEYLSESDQIESPETLAQRLVDLAPVASATIYETEAHEDNLLARVVTDGESHTPEKNPEAETSSEHEVRATFGLANGHWGLVILTLAESGSEPSVARDQAELAAVVLHALCPIPVDQTVVSDGALVSSTDRILNQLQIGLLELDSEGQIQHRNAVFDQLFENQTDLESLADLVELFESLGDKATAASIGTYFRASSGCDTPPRLCLNVKSGQTGSATLTFERLNPGSDDLSGCFLFSRVDSRSVADQKTIQAPIDLTLAGLNRLRSSMTAARSVWLKLEHEHHNELTRDGGFYLQCLSHHIDTVEQTLIELEQLLKSTSVTEETQVVDLGLVIDNIVAAIEARQNGPSLSVKHTDLPKVKCPLQKLTAALCHTIEAAMVRADTDRIDIRVTAAVADGSCTISIQDDGPQMTRKQARKAFEYVGPPTANQDQIRSHRPAGLAQALALIRSMGGRMDLDPDCVRGAGVKMVFPEA